MTGRPRSSARHPPGRPFLGLLLAALLPLLAACGGKPAKDPRAGTFPEYTPAEAVLFDDMLAPALFGFDPEARTPAKDPKLPGRTGGADYVVPVRVESISRVGGVEHEGAYELTLAPTGRSLSGDDHEGPIVLDVPTTSPAYAWVEGAGARWAGSRLIVFCKTFRQGDGTVLHFRGEPDTPEMRAAIERDAGLRQLR